jgi:hypothetical protein
MRFFWFRMPNDSTSFPNSTPWASGHQLEFEMCTAWKHKGRFVRSLLAADNFPTENLLYPKLCRASLDSIIYDNRSFI